MTRVLWLRLRRRRLLFWAKSQMRRRLLNVPFATSLGSGIDNVAIWFSLVMMMWLPLCRATCQPYDSNTSTTSCPLSTGRVVIYVTTSNWRVSMVRGSPISARTSKGVSGTDYETSAPRTPFAPLSDQKFRSLSLKLVKTRPVPKTRPEDTRTPDQVENSRRHPQTASIHKGHLV